MTSSEFTAPLLASAAGAFPSHYVEQSELSAALRQMWIRRNRDAAAFDRIQRALGVAGRYIALDIGEYEALDTFAKSNQAWIEVAPGVGEAAVRIALERAGLRGCDVDHLFCVTVTGSATPRIDTRIASALAMRRNVKRTPIFGLGCAAGASALARAADYVRAYPDEIALVVSVELCSLTLQKDDLSIANIIASGLFGDGGAAAVVAGAERRELRGPRIIATRAILYPDTEHVLGWDIVESGFKIVLASELPELVRANIGGDVGGFLAEHGLATSDIRHWIAHTGGPKVLRAMEQALELPEGALARSWRSLSTAGNLSSASVLFILAELLEESSAEEGDYGLV
ncbi:MAG: type III polyketide synthase, partial [Candidatus Binataceae bacterium]